jgi:hypothetical protein
MTLLITSGMMTFMTSFGLARILPRNSDWIARSRRVAPAFAVLTALMLAIVLASMAAHRVFA